MLRTTLTSFQRHNSSALAAGVAYYTLLSLFPLLIFAVSVLGIVMQDDARRREFTDDIISALPFEAVESDAGAGAEGATTELERNVRDAVDGVNGFSAVGLLGLAGTVWAASGLFATIRRALDIAWGVEEASRGIVHNKLVDVAMIAGIGLLLLASFALTTLVAIVRNVAGLPPELAALWQIAGTAITFGLTFAALMVMFRFVPDTDHPAWSTIWPGAIVGAVGFEALKFGFAIYVENFGRYNEVYGTLSAVVVFLFWAWLLAVIVLLGAELSAACGRSRHNAPERGAPAATGG